MELTKIKGISEKRDEDFKKMGITGTESLIRFFPRTYLDLRNIIPLKYAYHNDIVLTNGKIVSIPAGRFTLRKGFIKCVCEQEGLSFEVIWFNQPYVLSKLKIGNEYLFYGRVRNFGGELSLVNPSFELCEKIFYLQGIVPQYQIRGNLTQKVVRDSCRLAVNLEKPKSIIPFNYQKKYDLSDIYTAYKLVHNPNSIEDIEKSSDRIAVEEYFALISAFKIIKGDRNQVRVNKYKTTDKELLEFIVNRFPFTFTDGQKKAVNEIFADMKGNFIMNRLMQGDVGSGKTAVSLCSIFVAVKSGYQCAMLAPTEVLARQNFAVVKKVFSEYNVALLTGSTSLKEKKQIKEAVKNGYIDILVGTHAIIQDDVEFKNLSLCICDEQQRFGVAQRSSLLSKGNFPDVLVMSATPIPRTLSLIFYGDLDITTILDKPKDRIPVQTNIVPSNKYMDMLGFIKKEAENGNQTYFVCPKIEGDEEGSIMSVTELYNDLVTKLNTLKIALLHGKMKDKDKNQIMQDFKDKKYDVIVSTTVIEVGVDVPNATVMVIHDAERFGLSQLHQLRGRVGRSDKKSYCFLISKATNPVSTERLKILKDNTDGFKISEFDYKLRGGGDLLGNRQSGKTISDLGYLQYSTESVFLAKKISDEVFSNGELSDEIKTVAMEKYNRLKDITLN